MKRRGYGSAGCNEYYMGKQYVKKMIPIIRMKRR
jgi:hypothetical protein